MARGDRRWAALYCAAVFLLMFVFFAVIHPLVMFDSDDWSYISFARHAVPLWGYWNPTRVFPEVFMPLCGSIAAYAVFPLVGDYISSLTLVFAAVVSLFIAGYVHLFGRVLRERCGQPMHRSLLWATLFLALHFLIFRSGWEGNNHLFYAQNVTCYFYYMIPDLLNCSLVMVLMLNDALDDGWNKLRSGVYARHPVKNGFLLLALYMALLSNLFASVILAAYVGCQLVGELAALLRKRTGWKECLRKNSFRLGYVALWGIVQVIEAKGGRATWIGENTVSLRQNLADALRGCLNMCRSLNTWFIVLALALALSAMGLWLAGRGKPSASTGIGKLLPCMLGMGALVGTYTVLLCMAVGADYIYRPDVLFGVAFCFLFALMLCGAFIADRRPGFVALMPLMLCLVLCEINTTGHTFKDSVTNQLGGGGSAVSRDIVRQFTEAEERHETEIVLYVPRFDSSNNWPIATYANESIANVMYEHGVIDERISVTQIIPTPTKNQSLGLP